jgi:glycosyltransferase involved in cell wall biosynthesis
MDVRFTIAGEWLSAREERAAREECRRQGIEDRICFTRAVSGLRKAELFRSADLFVFPPRQLEGQPVVILEAMSYGLPVVTTAQGGIVDLVVDGATGVYVPPGAPESLADALSHLVGNSTLRSAMGKAGQRRFEENFNEHVFRARLTNVLREALSAAAESYAPMPVGL